MTPPARPWLRLLPEWAALTLLLTTAAAVSAQQQWLWRLDLALYDAALSSARPLPPDDVVIVAIDETSLATLGRWPWAREVHAALLDRLTRDGARAVGLDLILAEPDLRGGNADTALAEALRRNGRAVLPVLMEHDRESAPVETRPLPGFAASAASVGHIHLELDRDGIARSAFLREGHGSARHPHFALALLQVAGEAPAVLPGLRNPNAGPSSDWMRDHWVHFPFSGPPGTFRQVSYAEALGEKLPQGFFRDRIVLIGATAAGLGDVYPTPVSGQGIPMSGVEVSANLLSALREGRTLAPLPEAARAWLAPLPVLVVMVGYLGLSARRGLLLTAAALALLVATVVGLLHWGRLWFPPASSALCMLAAYPLWSWRRLEAAQRHLDGELNRLRLEPGLLSPVPVPGFAADPLEQRMEAVRVATEQLRDLRRLLSDTLDGLPEAALVADAEGRVVLANPRAAQYLCAEDAGALVGKPLEQLLASLAPVETPSDADHWEAVHPTGRELLLSRAPLRAAGGGTVGSILSMVDISALKGAQRKRDELLGYVSHDLRSPQASILALVQAQGGGSADPTTLTRIEAFAQRTLALAGNLVELSRAEAKDPRHFTEVDLAGVAHDAADEIWPQAQARGIRVERDVDVEAPARGDPHLLRRALVNLLGNAVKYSPAGTSVRLALARDGDDWNVSVTDEGYGIAPEDLPQVFERHRRFRTPAQPPSEGSGLGLALVRTVAEKHGGRAAVTSTPGRGSRFELRVPVLRPPSHASPPE